MPSDSRQMIRQRSIPFCTDTATSQLNFISMLTLNSLRMTAWLKSRHSTRINTFTSKRAQPSTAWRYLFVMTSSQQRAFRLIQTNFSSDSSLASNKRPKHKKKAPWSITMWALTSFHPKRRLKQSVSCRWLPIGSSSLDRTIRVPSKTTNSFNKFGSSSIRTREVRQTQSFMSATFLDPRSLSLRPPLSRQNTTFSLKSMMMYSTRLFI